MKLGENWLEKGVQMNRGSVLETWVVARSTHTRRLYMNESPHHTHAKVGGCSHHTSFIKWEKVFLLPWQATSPGPPCILPHVLSPPRASSFLMASPLSPPPFFFHISFPLLYCFGSSCYNFYLIGFLDFIALIFNCNTT